MRLIVKTHVLSTSGKRIFSYARAFELQYAANFFDAKITYILEDEISTDLLPTHPLVATYLPLIQFENLLTKHKDVRFLLKGIAKSMKWAMSWASII